MNLKGSDHDLEKDIINKENANSIEQSDEKLNDDEITVSNILKNIAYRENLNDLDNNDENQITCLGNYKTTNYNTINEDYYENKKINDLRTEVFFVIMIFLKSFFKKRFNLNFDSFKCDEVLGKNINQMRKILGLEIYQILCYYPENIKKIINFTENTKMSHKEKPIFYYFMTRTYEELYNRYILGDINFPLFKGVTLRICSFITLEKIISKKKGEYKRLKKEEQFIEEKIKAFKELSKNIIKDIKSEDLKKDIEDKVFITAVIDEFEIMRNYFFENSLSIAIELKE